MEAVGRYIKALKTDTSKVQLHMLVLSYLDYDHVSGVDDLLKFMKVKVAVLPYLSPVERVLLLLRWSSERVSAWYLEFLYDPVKYLLSRDVQFVVLVSSGRKGNDLGNGNSDNKDNLPPNKFDKRI